MLKSLASVDPVLSRELWQYLITGGLMFGAMCLLICKAAATRFMESLRIRLMGRGVHSG